MTTSKKRIAARFVAIAAAVGLSLGAFAPIASANPGPGQDGAPTTGKLTVNKYRGAETGTPSDGDRLSGVEFTVTRVGKNVGNECEPLDLADVAGWTDAEEVFGTAPVAPADPYCLAGLPETKQTEEGKAVFEDLPLGLYYVVEGKDHGYNDIVQKAQPFYVAIPMPDDDGGWDYNVVVNPKNAVMDAPTKTINESQEDLVLGAEVTWTITSVVPTLVKNIDTFTEASIVDTLDPRLTLEELTVTVDGETLTKDTDYLVTDNVKITFTADGLAKLKVNQGKELVITLTTTVDRIGEGDNAGVISNKATVSFNDNGIPTGEPHTYWGGIEITKVDSDSGSLLEGAEFSVFESDNGQCSTEMPSGEAVASATSNGSGIALFPGLWIDNSDEALDEPERVYCLYETQAPAGYDLAAFDHAVTVGLGNDAMLELEIKNPQRSGPQLPMTGSMGTVALTATGLGFVVLGFVVMAAARTRRLGSLS